MPSSGPGVGTVEGEAQGCLDDSRGQMSRPARQRVGWVARASPEAGLGPSGAHACAVGGLPPFPHAGRGALTDVTPGSTPGPLHPTGVYKPSRPKPEAPHILHGPSASAHGTPGVRWGKLGFQACVSLRKPPSQSIMCWHRLPGIPAAGGAPGTRSHHRTVRLGSHLGGVGAGRQTGRRQGPRGCWEQSWAALAGGGRGHAAPGRVRALLRWHAAAGVAATKLQLWAPASVTGGQWGEVGTCLQGDAHRAI